MDSGQVTLAKKSIRSFEDFEVFERAFKVSLTIHRTSLNFPKIEQFGLADQMRRASKSICANIAEGYGKQKQSPQEFRRFLSMSLGSSDEMRVWVRYSEALGYIDKHTALLWREEYLNISRMLQGLINRI